MEVQTYIEEDSEELIHDVEALDEWKEKVEELGLEGQNSLFKKDKSPIPFPHMNTHMQRVYGLVCPRKADPRKYDKGAIPLQVLSIIALCETEEYFDKMRIWYDDEELDPILVGRKEKDGYGHDKFILAKWAEELEDFEDTIARAIKRKARDLQSTAREAKRKAEQVLTDPQSAAEDFIHTGSSPDTIYW